MAPARLLSRPYLRTLVKRTSGDMIISGRVLGNDLLDEDLRVLPLAPTTPALTVGNPVRWYLVVANRHPKSKEAASIPALTSTSTADDRISSSPYAIQCMQPRSLGSAPTSQSIASRRSSPRAAQPYLDSRAIPMRFRTTHTVFEEVQPPRAAARRTADTTYPSIYPSGPASRVPNRRAIFVLLEEGTPRALAERLPIPLLRRSRASSIREDQER
ncbi:hypothetical protein B0H14DRAFT_3895194 [Mycena olivaceomarginata]|nr:hypothetical protein B0H14DRAFT_3895194 [Mycena olivaceomarginata]